MTNESVLPRNAECNLYYIFHMKPYYVKYSYIQSEELVSATQFVKSNFKMNLDR